jgi:putative spermidine/putrescine transport system permease protein
MRHRRSLVEFWYLVPPLGFLTSFLLIPLVLMLGVSFTEGYPLEAVPSLVSYRDLFTDTLYRSYLVTTILFGFAVTAATLAVGYPLAFFLVRQARRSYSLLLLAVVSPLLVSVVARTVGWIILLGNDGPVNAALLALGITSKPVQILFTPFAATIGMVHVLLPFMVLSLASVLSRQDIALEEAALSLGADRTRVFWRVTFPLSLRGVSVGCALVFLLAIGSFVTPALLGGGKIRLLAPMVYDQLISVVDWSTGSAMSVMLLVAGFGVLLLFRLAERVVRKS